MPDTYTYLEETIASQRRRIEQLEADNKWLRTVLRYAIAIIDRNPVLLDRPGDKRFMEDARAALRDTE